MDGRVDYPAAPTLTTREPELSRTRTRRIGLRWLLLCAVIFIVWGSILEHATAAGMLDFKIVYYGTQCLIHHRDPYQGADVLHVYQAQGGQFPSDPALSGLYHQALTTCINLPTALFLIAPLAMLPWAPAHLLWMTLVAGSLILAAFLIWDLAATDAPGIALFLVCMLLANCVIILSSGNLAGLAISLCVMAVWCFLKGRCVPAGILCLAVSLALKPHDFGFVWLYFLLAGAPHRKRALQTLLVTLVLCLPAVLWVSHIAPHWIPELHANLVSSSARGGINDPGPSAFGGHTPAASLIDLQSVISVFRDDPRIYNPVSYLVCGALLLAGAIHTLRSRFTTTRAWLALAAIAPLSLLLTYHRPYDAKLLLLSIPACTLLWAEGGSTASMALIVSTAGIVLTADIPSVILGMLTKHLHLGTGLTGELLTVLLNRSSTLALLAMSIFYLWAYMQHAPTRSATEESRAPVDDSARSSSLQNA